MKSKPELTDIEKLTGYIKSHSLEFGTSFSDVKSTALSNTSYSLMDYNLDIMMARG